MVIEFDGRAVTYGFGELDEVVLAYATTIHKSQGSEYPAVVIPLTTQHYPMLQRNLMRF
jgi:exodeoxyribonuclease V alpha subunit